MEINEATRVMGAAAPTANSGMDKTMVAGSAMAPPVAATQMGVTVTCPICRTNNSGMESFCGECGFLLTSAPGEEAAAPTEAIGPAIELVETTSGRRFRLKAGPNIVGRENCDILLMEATVSRRHAQVSLDNGAVIVTDLGSTNGTQVDSVPLSPNQPTTLNPGSTVRFGNATLTFSAAAAEPVAAPAEVTVAIGEAPIALSDQTLVGVPGEMAAPATVEAVTEATVAAEPAAAAPPADAVAVLRPVAAGGVEISVRTGTFTIGRRAGNDIVIATDPYISGAHAMIQCDANGCFLTDVGSTNGTTVNGTKLEANAKQLLLDGDEVMIGQTSYRYEAIAPSVAETVEHVEESPVEEHAAAEEEAAHTPDEVKG